MYNRYIQSDRGSYAPIPDEPTIQQPPVQGIENEPHKEDDKASKKAGASLERLKELYTSFACRLHLDSGDLLLLALLYFLYREDADEELLIALGLLLLL